MHSDCLTLFKQKSEIQDPLVFISGNFNIIHPGHIRLLNFAASLGGSLIVALYPDSPIAYVPGNLRLSAMQAMNMVACCFLMDCSLEATLRTLRPAIVVKGKEYELQSNTEEIIAEWNGKLLFCTDEVRFSSKSLLYHHLQQNSDNFVIPKEYLSRHVITMHSMMNIINNISNLNVCIIGDTIIDEYIDCLPVGMSREDPTLVVSPLEKSRYVGGAGIVAGHAHKLGAKVHFFTVIGKDDIAEYAYNNLIETGVSLYPLYDSGRPTTLKQRFRAQGKTLLRLNTLSAQHIGKREQRQVLDKLLPILPDTDLLIFSDFSYGMLPVPLIETITQSCIAHNVLIAADSQTSSQQGDISRFRQATLLTPTELEIRHALHNFEEGLVATATALLDVTSATYLVITLGENGCLIHCHGESSMLTDQLPAFNLLPRDVAGAGDSLLTTTALALATGADIWHSALLGSLAAGIQVSRTGNTPLSKDELLDTLGKSMQSEVRYA